MPSEETNAITRREWRELGFFYELDDIGKRWRIVGSRSGLGRFCDELANFAANPKNEQLSEHVHLGPYMYLEIGSWSTPETTDHWIAGPLASLRYLADVMRTRIILARATDVLYFRDVYAPGSPYELTLELRDDDFDPAKEDEACW